ncbi:MAG: hypothetical protein AB9903_30730 [Vulcanimicrobiota bacterium]
MTVNNIRLPLLMIVLLASLVFSGCGFDNPGPTSRQMTNSSTPVPEPAVTVMPAVPSKGVYLGAILLQGQTSIDEFNSSTAVRHALFGEFIKFPEVMTDASENEKLRHFVAECKAAGAMPMVTLETSGGLESYSSADAENFADLLYGFHVSLFLRWNHEMNGSWYPWGQKPTLYIQKFREFADILHKRAPNAGMTWTPNQGWGYPWAGGTYSISPGDPDFSILDTNHDGQLTEADDPYGPYYPGDAYVDWVGHSFYHWSNIPQRGYNQVPYTGKWGQANGINNTIPNFHDIFAVGHDKPMIIAETSAFYDPLDTNGGGAAEDAIKEEWIKQVYNLSDPDNPTLKTAFPKLKAIFWFSQLKYEQEVQGEVDWRLNSLQSVIDYYRGIVSDPYFIKAP